MIVVVRDETCHPVAHHQPTTREQIDKLGLSPSPCLPPGEEPKRRSDGGVSLVVENPGRPSSSSLHVATLGTPHCMRPRGAGCGTCQMTLPSLSSIWRSGTSLSLPSEVR